MDPYRELLADVLRMAGEIFHRRVEVELQAFATALNAWLYELFAKPRRDWHAALDQFFAQQEAAGRVATPESRQALAAFLEEWAKTVWWDASSSAATIQRFGDDNESLSVQPGPSVSQLPRPSGEVRLEMRPATRNEPRSPAGRGNQMPFSRQAEEVVSEATGVPRNQAPRQQTISGSGPGGYRIPDFKVWGPDGSIRQRGAVIEVKASRGKSFGELSGRSRQQIEDAVEFILRLRDKATLVKDPTLKASLSEACVEVFSDLAPPTRGRFARLITDKFLKWNPIPRPLVATETVGRGALTSAVPNTTRSIGKPGIGAAANIALGVVASLAEAGVADAAYRDAATALKGLLNQIAQNGEANEADWQQIEGQLKEIANLKQTALAFGWELVTYGQGSLKERQALRMMKMASELADQFGYKHYQTWGDVFSLSFGRYVKTE